MEEKNVKGISYMGDPNQAVREACYKAYQLDWMLSHGFSLSDLYDAQLEQMQDMFDPGDYVGPDGRPTEDAAFDESDLARSMEQARDQVLFGKGLEGGAIFASMGEFLENEYLDAAYMKGLFSRMPTDRKMAEAWMENTGIGLMPDSMSVPTAAGIIRAVKCCDPNNPGIAVTLLPAGSGAEIDLFLAEVNEMTGFDERSVDVVLRTWGDPTQDDYTSKVVVRREDVMERCGLSCTWDDLYRMAENSGFGDPELRAKDNARWQVHELAIEQGCYDLELEDCPEDAVEDLCDNLNIRFDRKGNILTYDRDALPGIPAAHEKSTAVSETRDMISYEDYGYTETDDSCFQLQRKNKDGSYDMYEIRGTEEAGYKIAYGHICTSEHKGGLDYGQLLQTFGYNGELDFEAAYPDEDDRDAVLAELIFEYDDDLSSDEIHAAFEEAQKDILSQIERFDGKPVARENGCANELMICLEFSGDYLYYKTGKKTADKAFYEFLVACDNAGINTDNLHFGSAWLRNESGQDIDRLALSSGCMKAWGAAS